MSTIDETNEQSLAPELNLAEYWHIIVKRRRLIFFSILTALALGAVVSLLSKPIYKATVVLNVEREKSTPLDLGPTTGYGSYDPEFVPTQTRLMKSREVAERAVVRLNLTRNPQILVVKSGFFRPASKIATDGEAARAAAAAVVQQNVQTTPVRGTGLVELSYVAGSPKLAADVANAIVESYIDWHLESKFAVVGQATRFLTAQIEQLKSDIDRKEQQLQSYGKSKDIVSIDPDSNVTFQKLASFNRDYAAAVADRVAKEARYTEWASAKPEAIADSLSNGFVAQLRNEQARLEREYADKLNVFKPEWPAMVQLKSQIDKGRQNLNSVIQETVTKARDAARTDYLTALRREQSLAAVLQGQKTEAMTQNSNAVEYNNLKTEVETKRTLLDTLLKRQSETEVTARLSGQRISSVRVVDRALPPLTKFRPSYTRNALLSLIVGTLAGLGLVLLLENLDRSLRSTEQVERILRLPALGVIPAVSAGTGKGYGYGYGYAKKLKKNPLNPEEAISVEMLPHTHPRSTLAEAYRAFRTALMLSRAGGVQTIVITSSLPSEGKTTTAVNLSIVLSQLGKRVLIVDADLHKPRVHEVFRTSNRSGLVSVLAENIPAGDVISKTIIPGLFVMPAGPISPNPSGLISSETMTAFLEFAKANFDHIIIDTPPISPVSDAILIGHQVDGVVLCAKGGFTAREHVIRARDKLLRSNVRILGVLINNLREEHSGYGKYYQHYYAGHTAYGEETSSGARAAAG